MKSFDQQRREYLARKFGLDRLQIEGMTPKEEATTTPELVKEYEKGTSKLSVSLANTKFKTSSGQELTRFWYEVK